MGYFTKTFTFDGKRYYVRGKTEAEAIKNLILKQQELENGENNIDSNMSLSKWSSICISTYKTRAKENSRKAFTYRVERYILPQIGNIPLSKIKPIHCQEVLNNCSHLSQYIINQVYISMNFLFNKAVDNNLLSTNPARSITKPVGSHVNRRPLTSNEEQAFLKACEKDPRFVLFLLMYYCGCRPGEARELKGSDMSTVDGEHLLHIRGTKTAKSDRFVPIPTPLYEKIKSTPRFSYIALNSVGKGMDEKSYRRAWSSLKREMNILLGCRTYRNKLIPPFPLSDDFVPYSLRHTYCTNLQRQGIDIRAAQYLMGHADIKMTANIYTHNDKYTAVDAAKLMKKI